MKKKIIQFLILFFLFFIIKSNVAYAFTCPNYSFQNDLQKGATSEDVRVIQEILNLDNRTIVANTGVGSRGNETRFFGIATREALKRFQALFIEYVEVADGKFNEKTRVVMNSVCAGPFFSGNSKSPYDLSKNQSVLEKIPPQVGISGPASSTSDVSFRIYLAVTEPVKQPTLNGLIISGATANDVRKTSSTTYSILITPNEDVGDKVTLQFEADSIVDLSGNKNEEASNEWVVAITKVAKEEDTGVDPTLAALDGLLPSITPTDCSTVASVDINDYNNPCYGRAPVTQTQSPNQETPPEKKPPPLEQIMQLMQGLMKALGGAGGGKDGGSAGADGMCACTGEPTTMLIPKGGMIKGGAYKTTTNPRSGNSWVGSVTPPAGICGFKKTAKGCEQPMFDNLMRPYSGNVGPPGVFNWGG